MKIGFTGDVAFSEYTKDISKNEKAIDEKILKFLNQNDYNIINFESPITDSVITKKTALAHKSDSKNLKFIKQIINNPILSIANNHMMDFGIKGIKDTIKNINSENLPFIGAGLNQDEATNYIIVGDEVKVGIISFQYKNYMIARENNPGTAHNSHSKIIKKKIKELKKQVDWVVLVYHGGDEFLNLPLPFTVKKYRNFLKWGVDILVGHHPHTVQGFEKIKDKMIFYSLGNFIFDTDFQRAQKGTDEGILLSIKFDKKSYSYKKIAIKNNRHAGIINIMKNNTHFNDINIDYKKYLKKETLELASITQNKKHLKFIRNNYSINNLYFKKTGELQLMDFTELVKNNYIPELEDKPKFNDKNIVDRVIRKQTNKLSKIKNISKDEINRKIYTLYAKKKAKIQK